MQTRVLVPSGVLGLGFDPDALARGVAANPDIIAIDGGSTDSGPFYLGTGTSKYSRSVCRDEWRQLLEARATAGVPAVSMDPTGSWTHLEQEPLEQALEDPRAKLREALEWTQGRP